MAPRSGISDLRLTKEMSNYSFLKFDGAGDATMTFQFKDKSCRKNADRFSSVLILKAQYTARCVHSLAVILWTMLNAFKNQLFSRSSSPSNKPCKEKFLYRFISGQLVLFVILLVVEMVAHWNEWHLSKTTEIRGWTHSAYLSWIFFRVNCIAYPLQAMSNLCVILFIIQSIDRILLCIGWFWIKFRNIKPRIEGDSFENVQSSESKYPLVLVQIPMCNEREVRHFNFLSDFFSQYLNCGGLFWTLWLIGL